MLEDVEKGRLHPEEAVEVLEEIDHEDEHGPHGEAGADVDQVLADEIAIDEVGGGARPANARGLPPRAHDGGAPGDEGPQHPRESGAKAYE